jgi:hypothetical protein
MIDPTRVHRQRDYSDWCSGTGLAPRTGTREGPVSRPTGECANCGRRYVLTLNGGIRGHKVTRG